jgi:hypothetical protein
MWREGVVLWTKPRASSPLGKCSTTELNPQPLKKIFLMLAVYR